MNWEVVLRQTDEGYSAWCPGLPGGLARGETEEEAVANLAGAIERYVAPMKAAGMSCHLRRLQKGLAGVEMDVQPAGGVWTYEEFAKLPDEHREWWEIIAGELYLTATRRVLHQVVVSSVLIPMFTFAEDHTLGFAVPGPLDVLFAVGDFMAPDGLFVRRDRLDIVADHAIEGVPDLIVEVVSEETAERDRGIKRERYARYGVPEYWIVDAERRAVDIYHLREDPVRPWLVATDGFSWQPVPGGPVLPLRVPELLRKHDKLKPIIEENSKRGG